MANTHILKRKPQNKKGKLPLAGPMANTQGIPYDYIVVIDAGSSGSRAYIYNWLNAKYLNEKELQLNLVKRIEQSDNDTDSDSDTDTDTDTDDDDHEITKGDMENTDGNTRLPQVRTRPKWHRKIKPGVSSFSRSPGKIGKDHIKLLLDKVGKIIPPGQHQRTPIFMHATAGMRLLKPQEQETLLDNICKYIKKNYDYYLPDCLSHINIIDGDVEGLYGWLGLNYLMGSLDEPMMHDHGKNHSTYGLLDMGGASTQISFQPNSTEEAEHANALFKVQLSSLGKSTPDLNYNVFSTSFLGFGINKLHENYLLRLQNSTTVQEPLTDPCLPKGLTSDNNQILGVGNFSQCMDLIYPLLVASESSDAASCSSAEPLDISSCLLTNSIPSLDFDVDKFVGVSGYWDAISNMLGIQNISQYGNAYSYQSFYLGTEKICQTPWEELDHYNDDDIKTMFGVLTDSELTELCFKSSWILNILHRGLGFPKIDLEDSNTNIKPFQVAESINGSEFSWTLGRAILYATWENAKYFANDDTEDIKIGYYHASSPNLFIYGGEKKGVLLRPLWSKDHKNELKSDSKGHKDDDDDDDWELDDIHKSYSSLILFIIIGLVIYFILGPKKRHLIYKNAKKSMINTVRKLKIPFLSSRYMRLQATDFELSDMADERSNNNTVDEIDDTFLISDDDE